MESYNNTYITTDTAKKVLESMEDVHVCLAYHDILCGKLLGEGSFRSVYECLIDPTCVVKIQHDIEGHSNMMEWEIWNYVKDSTDGTDDWFAPCIQISLNGRILIQKKVKPFPDNYKFPDKIPSWFTDIKARNFGLYKGKFVACDYDFSFYRLGHYGFNPKRMQKVKQNQWYDY